jgi:hypothetical protein
MEQFVGSDLVLLTLTVGFYCLGSALYSRTKFALLHPVLLGFVAMILYLKLFGIGYEHYRRSTELLNFGLGLSVVALGYLMYEQLEHMRGRLLPILVSVVVGCVVGVLSVVYLARMLGADRILQTSLAPKSVTVPIAVSVAARRHHYDHLGRRLLCRYFRQSRRSLAASALRGHGSYGTGIRAGVCGAWHRNGPCDRNRCAGRGAQRFGYGTDGDHDGPAAAGDREIPLLIFCLPEKGLPLQKFFRAEA